MVPRVKDNQRRAGRQENFKTDLNSDNTTHQIREMCHVTFIHHATKKFEKCVQSN